MLEHTTEGLEARLRPRGIGRFFSAAFLSVWLCGWLVGECFALWMLIRGGFALLTGTPPGPGAELLELVPALMVGLFLVFWLSFWTLGGYLAARELLRVLWSEDRILAASDALVVRRRLGPFRSTTRIPRHDLLRVYGMERKGRLMAETTGGAVELTSHAPREECATLAAALGKEMGLSPDRPVDATSLPERWQEVQDAEGGTALVENEDTRRKRGRVAWIMTLVCGALTLLVAFQSADQRGALPMAAILAAATIALAWGSWRITMTRLEWRLDPRRLRLRRRGGGGVKEIFEGDSLELLESHDSDGDPWFTLNVVAAGAPPPDPTYPLADRRWRRRIAREMDDPTVPRRLGAWLVRRGGLRLEDRTTAERRKLELDQLIARLESGGRFSRWMARHIPRR